MEAIYYSLIQNYQTDVLAIFKKHYKRLITKSIDTSFNEVLTATLFELDLKETKDDESLYLKRWFELVHEQSFIKDYLQDSFQEIIFHSHEHLQVIKSNIKESIEITDLSSEDYQLSIEILALRQSSKWNFANPFASFNVKINNLNLRATLIHFSSAPTNTTKVFLRCVHNQTPELNLFKLDSDLEKLLKDLVINKRNIIVSGATGSGKTTLIRSLINEIPKKDHVVVLEDTYEIINENENQTSLLANAHEENKSLKDYCSYAMRMSPDRMIIGEMRSHEVVPFLLAMNTGHKGLMSTIHSNSAVDAVSRIAMLFSLYSENKDISFSLVTKLICKSVDYIVHIENKQIKEIIQLIGSQDETPFFELIYSRVN